MSAPERIMAWPSFGPNSVTGEWSANTYYDERAEEYVHAETVATLITQARAEALEEAKKAIQEIEGRVEYASVALNDATEWSAQTLAPGEQTIWDWIFQPAAAIRARKDEA